MLKSQIEKQAQDMKLYREQQKEMQQQMHTEVERRTKERTNMLQLKTSTLEERIKQVQEQHEKDKSRVHELEKRYELVSKGLEFEKTIYDNLVQLNDTYYNNIWEIVHVGQTFLSFTKIRELRFTHIFLLLNLFIFLNILVFHLPHINCIILFPYTLMMDSF